MSLPGKTLFTEAQLRERVRQLGSEISRHYENSTSPLTVIGLMNGSIFFMVDLVRHLPYHTQIECWKISSYQGTSSTGKLQGLDAVPGDYSQRHVLVLDDILDTGLTLSKVREKLLSLDPLSIEFCVLLSKNRPRLSEITPKWVGFEIKDQFVVGYGLDLNHQYRPLPMIRVID